MATERELSMAFYPGTLAGLADSWWQECIEINRIRADKNNHEQLLLDASVKDADMSVDPAFRVGSIIEGTENISKDGEVKTVRVRAIWSLEGDGKQWKAKLQKVQ